LSNVRRFVVRPTSSVLRYGEAADPVAAGVVKLRYFAGLSMPEAAAALGLPLRTAERNWTYARTWLHRELARTI
jgi:DNA-directed RNA polymerase specialized sigma24 family protein